MVETLEDRRLLSATLTVPEGYIKLQSIDVFARNSGDQGFSVPLEDGATYYVVAGTPDGSGTGFIDGNMYGNTAGIGTTPSGDKRRTDALKFDSTSEHDGFSKFTAGNAGRFTFTGVQDGDGDGLMNWGGVYHEDHVYGQVVQAAGTHFGVEFRDAPLSDNSGYITLSLYKWVPVEIEINQTADEGDDAVRLASDGLGDVQASRPTVFARVRLARPQQNDLAVALDNPNGHLAFGGEAAAAAQVAASNLSLLLPKDGSWVNFQVAGVGMDVTKGESSIRVTANGIGQAGGAVLGTKGMSVFWFSNASIKVTAGGANELTFPPGEALVFPVAGTKTVKMAAAATIQPANLDMTMPQIRDLRIGIAQNVLEAHYTFTYKDPVMNWTAGVPAGTTVTVPETVTVSEDATGPWVDGAPNSIPLYDVATTPPNGVPVVVDDSPPTSAPAKYLLTNVKTAAGAVVGSATYDMSQSLLLPGASVNLSLATWCVVYDSSTKSVVAPLRETTWKLQVALNNAAPQFATPLGYDYAPSTPLKLTGPLANDAVAPALQKSTILFGDVTITH